MSLAIVATKRVVRDVEVAERFYCAMGMKVVSRQIRGETVGEAETAQEQSHLSATGDAAAPGLLLCHFYKLPPPPVPFYPGEAWLVFSVADVETMLKTVELEGGRIVRPGEDQPQYGVRAAVVSDPDGYLIELVSPLAESDGAADASCRTAEPSCQARLAL
jgi:catechol 2,3-dioxygenase-like lactoylglutathione lyase family enzyme